MSMYRYPMVNLWLAGDGNPKGRTFVFDKDVSSQRFLRMAANEIAIQEEMKRRKVRFLPQQVIRRVLLTSPTNLNPFAMQNVGERSK